jgi:hypothetical protein
MRSGTVSAVHGESMRVLDGELSLARELEHDSSRRDTDAHGVHLQDMCMGTKNAGTCAFGTFLVQGSVHLESALENKMRLRRPMSGSGRVRRDELRCERASYTQCWIQNNERVLKYLCTHITGHATLPNAPSSRLTQLIPRLKNSIRVIYVHSGKYMQSINARRLTSPLSSYYFHLQRVFQYRYVRNSPCAWLI